MDQSLVAVMRNINDALRLDDDSHDNEAYLKYLDCILCITCNLQQYVKTTGGGVVITKQVTKQVKLAQQCIDRVAVIVDRIGSSQQPAVLTSPPECGSSAGSLTGKSKPFMVVPPLPSEPAANTFARTKVDSPMEIAYKQNHQLMTAYKARLKRMNKGDPGAFNLSLTIQRKMAENLAIAKKTEMALAKKMQERQERLEEQAAKRFVTPIGMSEEEQERRQIYKKILEYEQDAKWLQEWREKLHSSPQEPELICQLIQEILRCSDHPLTVLLKQYQYKIYEKIYPIVANKKQRLDAVAVPLAQSLWPPELCDTAVKEECRLSLFPEHRGERREATDGENEGEGSQSDQHSVSKSSSEQGVGEESTVTVVNASVDSSDSTDAIHMQHNVNLSHPSTDLNMNSSELSSESTSCDDNEESTSLVVNETSSHIDETKEDDCHPTEPDSSEGTSDSVMEPDMTTADKNDRDSEDEKPTDCVESDQALSERHREVTPTDQHPNSTHTNTSTTHPIAQLVEDPKENVSEALTQGEHLQTKLKAERAKAARILSQISNDYEKYNEENMDDLFDDDEENSTATNSSNQTQDAESQRTTQVPQYPSLSSSSQSSQQGPSSSVSRSSSGSSAQDFPSLPVVDESQSEMTRLSKEAYLRHLKNISADVHLYMEKLLILFTIAYEQLDSPVGRDQCLASLEETFFKPLWKFLLMLFRLANYQDELSVACKMTQRRDMGPRDMGVTRKLCLQPTPGQECSSSSGSESVPYQQAISHLMCVKNHYTMLGKLECIVKVVHLIFDSIKEFYVSQGCQPSDIPSVGADDLLPVMTYVVMKSHLPQLVSECHAMSEFIHEGYMMGQEGYCLTTLETAVSFLVSSDLTQPISPS